MRLGQSFSGHPLNAGSYRLVIQAVSGQTKSAKATVRLTVDEPEGTGAPVTG